MSQAARVLRAWLFPLRRAEAWAGWLQLLWLVGVVLIPSIGFVAAGVAWSTRFALYGLLALLLGLALWALWNHVPNPKLTIVFDPSTAEHRRDVADDKGNRIGEALYFGTEVRSRSRIRCRGRLVALERLNVLGEYDPVSGFAPIGLRWHTTEDDYMSVEITPHEPARLNLVNTESMWTPCMTMLCVKPTEPRGHVNLLDAGGTFRLTVRVEPVDVNGEPAGAHTDATFIAYSPSKWDELKVRAE